ncbi:hypothetical protein [Coleofasciculus chthonoplastes]|jgi:hypothetical protein|uniref:hypothetical protein n=1 Tax=Coleofasciculus chthonoplastes TaxID=64178 RepID=UPI0032F48BB0
MSNNLDELGVEFGEIATFPQKLLTYPIDVLSPLPGGSSDFRALVLSRYSLHPVFGFFPLLG